MKVELESLTGHNKKLIIEVPPDTVTAHIDGYYRELQKQVELKGFRKGKAPISMIKELYADSARGRIVQQLVEGHLWKAMNEHSLSPISMPQLDVEAIKENMPFKFTATFEAWPPVNLNTYTGLVLQKPAPTVEPAEVQTALANIQKQMAEFEATSADTAAQIGHFVKMNYEATEAGVVVDQATEKDAVLELGSGSLTPDFEKNVIGLKAGDKRNFTVKFPTPEKEEERTPVSGRTLDFSVEIQEVRVKKLSALDDEFAKKLGPFTGIDDVRNRIEQDLKNQKTQTLNQQLQEKAVDWLIEQNPVETSETLVNRQMEQLAIDAGTQLSQMGLDEKAIEERLKQWAEEMNKRATRQVKISMLLGAISKKESIQASDEDVRKEITRIALQSKRDPKDVLEEFRKKDLIGGLVRQITELKTLDWVINEATSAA